MHKISSHNLQHNLLLRESNLTPGRRHPMPHWFLFHGRNFYKSITPRLTIQNVDKPHGALRRFTPNGQLLLVFTKDQKSLDVYQYLGVGKVAHLLCGQQDDCITAADNSLASLHIRQEIFNSLFKKKFHIPIIPTPSSSKHYLAREFSLFLENGDYVLIGSISGDATFPTYTDYQEYTDMFDGIDLYDTSFYLIDLRKGRVTDTLNMKGEFVVLPHNHSVSLYGHTLAILSTYRQCIDIFEINIELGKLERLFVLGPFGSGMDRDLILGHLRDTNFTLDSDHSLPFSHMKQRILAFKYRQIMKLSSPRERREQLKEFYKEFEQIERMIIVKMQLIDTDHLLLRYEKRPSQMSLELIDGRTTDTVTKDFRIYVFYNISEQKVLQVCPKDSIEVLKVLRNCCDEFRNVRSSQVPWNVSSPSNNHHFRRSFDHTLCKYAGSISAAAARFNTTLPISSQSYSSSPYLDYSLFSYDDRFISNLERPKLVNTMPIRFCDRQAGILKFSIYLEQPTERPEDYDNRERYHQRNLVSFIYHPYEPFIISVQKLVSRYVMNFHLYNSNTITKKQLKVFLCNNLT